MTANTTGSKTAALVEAARRRTAVVQEANEENKATAAVNAAAPMSDEEVSVMKDGAEEMASIKVQPRAGTLDGTIDIEAMGDVKGDGGDAKDYPDGDPAKALGVPVYVHGLHETTVDGSSAMEALNRNLSGTRQSARTQAELDRGRQALSDTKSSREIARSSRTVVTDASEDPSGDNGAAKAAADAEAAKAAKAAKAGKTT